MRDSWQLSTGDAEERRTFADLATTLLLPSAPAGPPNRLRNVVRIDAPTGAAYLKTFASTQWKNRLRFLVTAPRAADDAEREWRVTEALRASGFAAPRPLARGRRGAMSFYLCAELPGASCRELLARGEAAPDLWRLVASHCGTLLAAGFLLPDLSADHVFAVRDGGTWRLGVLDLHNGTIGPARPVPRRIAVRVLRRFVHSVRGLPIAWPRALAFAARLLRAAGRRHADARAVLTSLPPFATARRYEAPGKSSGYAQRNPGRAARELQLLQRVWPGRAGETVLDLPCGTGRLAAWLAGTAGHRVVQADGAAAMLREARARGDAADSAVQADALSMPFRDGAVDGVVMFRFLHHLPAGASDRAIAEACRVARRFVVVSFFHPCSLHHVQRLLRRLGGGADTRFARRLGDVRGAFARAGFRLVAHAAQLPFARDLWLASFERTTPVAGADRA